MKLDQSKPSLLVGTPQTISAGFSKGAKSNWENEALSGVIKLIEMPNRKLFDLL
jgi:hypothetical protein